MEQRPKKRLDPVREVIPLKQDSIRTEEASINGIRRYILFHHQRHPHEMGSREIEAFLTHLADGISLSINRSFMNAQPGFLSHCLRETTVCRK